MKINMLRLPIKAHYFFFMASLGPILPQLPVFGKQLGVSPVVMGLVTGILPIMFLLAKPAFGYLADRYRTYRKHIFCSLIVIMGVTYATLCFIPFPKNDVHISGNACQPFLHRPCNNTLKTDDLCNQFNCSLTCDGIDQDLYNFSSIINFQNDICLISNEEVSCNSTCDILCQRKLEMTTNCTLISIQFWTFVIFMSIGTIGFNVVNSISDAICFDVLEEGEMDYGKQRVWGTIGFGLSALFSGYIVDRWSVGVIKTITPAIIIMLAFLFIDLLCCSKLKLPIIKAPKSILKDVMVLLKHTHIKIFILFSTLVGIIDSFILYFFFWYLEELALKTGNFDRIKLLEGIIIAAETLGGELLFFSISGSILKLIGYGHTLTMCFLLFALRLGLISTITSPWWAIPIEFFLQGPTYALSYTTIVAYANAISPPGTSATMQGLVAGMDDGFGYAIGSFIGGFLYLRLGGQGTLNVFTVGALLCAILHAILYLTILKDKIPKTRESNSSIEYQLPTDALNTTELNNDM